MTLLTRLESWLKSEEAKATEFFHPVILSLEQNIKQDGMLDLAAVATAVSASLGSGGTVAAAIPVAIAAVRDAAVKQGVQLAETTATALGAALVEGAQQTISGPPVNS